MCKNPRFIPELFIKAAHGNTLQEGWRQPSAADVKRERERAQNKLKLHHSVWTQQRKGPLSRYLRLQTFYI